MTSSTRRASPTEEATSDALTTSVTVRDVPKDVRDELAARAARSGKSLQGYLREQLIELAERTDMAALMAQIEERKRRTQTRLSAEEILAHIHADRT